MPVKEPTQPPAGSNELILYRLGQMETKQDKRDTKIDAHLEIASKDRVDLRLCMERNTSAITSIKEDVDELKSKSNRNDLWTGIVSTIAAVLTSVGITWNK